MPYHHGVQFIQSTGGARPVRQIATSHIGVVCTGDAADAAAFPLNTPVHITDTRAGAGKSGDEGTLPIVMQALADHGANSAVVVRVAEGEDAEDTQANTIGATTDGNYTGLQALLTAESVCGVRPRILGVPGLDGVSAVATALAVVARKLRGMGYAAAIGDTPAEISTYRDNFSQRELMLIAGDFKAFNSQAASPGVETSFATARALGLRSQIDNTHGFNKTLSNVGVAGVTGIVKPYHFDLQDPNTDVGLINAADVTALIRTNGFRFWGSRTCSDDPNYAFESTVRTDQVIRDTIAAGLEWAMDKPLHPSLIKDILATINGFFADMKAGGYIIGARAWFDPSKNPNVNLSAGKAHINYAFTATPPLEQIDLEYEVTDEFFEDFAGRIAA